jgi:hypothetical protein
MVIADDEWSSVFWDAMRNGSKQRPSRDLVAMGITGAPTIRGYASGYKVIQPLRTAKTRSPARQRKPVRIRLTAIVINIGLPDYVELPAEHVYDSLRKSRPPP